jgi:hypothetical protein
VTNRSLAQANAEAKPAPPLSEGQDHPHACSEGWVSIGQMVVDEETGEEAEEYAMYLCRRCEEKRQ